jgi:peptidylprolyl isomerase
MMLKSNLSIAFFATLCNALHVCAWTADNGNARSSAVNPNRRQALVVGASSVFTGLVAFTPMPALAKSDLSGFQDGPRGIKYQILKEGEGDKPVRAQNVKTIYTLWTGGFGEDGGNKVDSTTGFLGRPFAVTVGVGGVIKGWDLTLLDMKLGEVRRIAVPSDLGYGDAGAGGKIPPKATLYFEVELAEMQQMFDLTDTQKKWLEDYPL